MPTISETQAAELAALLRARNPLIVINTREERRVEKYIAEACAAASYMPRFWDCAVGCTNLDGTPFRAGSTDPSMTLEAIQNFANGGTERQVFIMRDLNAWLSGAVGILTSRQLRNLARELPRTARERAQSIIIIAPNVDLPPELQGHATVIDWPLPDRAEIAASLDVLIQQYKLGDMVKNGARELAIDAAIGLSGEEASACYGKSLVQFGKVDPIVIGKEKKRAIAREKVLEWFDPLPGGLDAVGGLDVLKTWLNTRSMAYSPAARAYGVPSPKGALLVGISGCGKSLTAKAVATAWQCPLLRFDLGALQSKFVGESQANIRKAFKVIESVGRCVVWLDELEKSLAGATQGAADGGVSADALGSILSWMQDRTNEAFVVATANDVSGLPPELLRKGRFDEMFFVDLPNTSERAQIVTAALRAHGRGALADNTDLPEEVALVTASFTGAEIAALVPDALFAGFADGAREITTADLVAAARNVVPLSQTAKDKIDRLREWAKGRARMATTPEKATRLSEVRTLDM